MNSGSNGLYIFRDSIHNYELFKKWELLFVHLNIYSLLPIRLLALNSNAHLISLSETNLDSTILDEEIAEHGYSMIWSNRCRNGDLVACYVRNYIYFNVNEVLSYDIENIFFDIVLPKTKPISIGVIYQRRRTITVPGTVSEANRTSEASFKQLGVIFF